MQQETKGVDNQYDTVRNGFSIQVAALNDPDLAKQMREQIASGGMAAYTKVVPTAKSNVTRVHVGPYTTREFAEKARDQLTGMGFNGNIVSLE